MLKSGQKMVNMVKNCKKNGQKWYYPGIYPGIYWYLPVLPVFTGIYQFYRYLPVLLVLPVVPVFSSIYRYLPVFTPVFTGIYRYLPVFTGIYRYLPRYYPGIYPGILGILGTPVFLNWPLATLHHPAIIRPSFNHYPAPRPTSHTWRGSRT